MKLENYKFHSTGQFRNVVKNMKTSAQFKGLDEQGEPLIGCGLAGGDWEIVKEILHCLSSWYQIDVTVFVLDDKYLEG